MVETDRFIAYFIEWAGQHFKAIHRNKYLSDHIRLLVDPEDKHFITVASCRDLLNKLRDPVTLTSIKDSGEFSVRKWGNYDIRLTLMS